MLYKYRKNAINTEADTKQLSKIEIIQKIKYAKDLIQAYKKNPSLDLSKLYANLKALKSIIENYPANSKLAPTQLTEYLGTAEAHETVRIERWANGIKCPYCECDRVQLIAEENRKLHDYYHYLCSECRQQFNDGTKSPLEHGNPSIEVWMEIWYLYGCTQNISYIASKFGIEVHRIKNMINALQKLFDTQKPATKLEEKFDKWQQKYSAFEKSIKENIIEKTDLLHGKDTPKQAKDTAEHRKQQNRKNLLNIRPNN